jgi:hypothetical protein
VVLRWLLDDLRKTWLWWHEPAWRHSEQPAYWFIWLLFWTWTVGGLVGGALLAPSLVQFAGLADASYKDWGLVAAAVVMGFLIRILGWAVVGIVYTIVYLMTLIVGRWSDVNDMPGLILVLPFVLVLALPLAGVGYSVYRYFSWIGPGQHSVLLALAGAFVGALLSNRVVFPLINATLFKWLVDWLRGKETKPAA